MNMRELSNLDLDSVTGGMGPDCKITAVNDLNLGIFGTFHFDTVTCGGKDSTAVSYTPYKPA